MKNIDNYVSTIINTPNGAFNFWVRDGERGQEPIALSTLNLDSNKDVLVRIHSECITGDVFNSLTCDCGPQKEQALKEIGKYGNGIFIYHRQEGRNMGIFKKIQAYNLMSQGLDTYEANILLSGSPDAREYSDAVQILDKILNNNKSKIILLSNNPYKKIILERHGYQVVMRPLIVGESTYNIDYTNTKKEKFLHYLTNYKPYVGVTLSINDIYRNQNEIINLIKGYKIENNSRRIFLGIPVSSQNGDFKNTELIKKINKFASNFNNSHNICIVLHMDYSERRQFYRDLLHFLSLLDFRYSIQLRPSPNQILSKIDFEIIDSLNSENVVFQINKENYSLFECQKFIEYFRSSNSFLLLDDSFGKGIQEKLLPVKEKIMGVIRKGVSHLAVAGGYDPSKLNDISTLEDYFKIPISLDAESKLHDNGKLDMGELHKYLGFFFPSI